MIHAFRKYLLVSAVVAVHASAASAQVVDWFIFKEREYAQTANNTQPSAVDDWYAGAIVETTNPGDATSVTISGGGLGGPQPLLYLGGGEWCAELNFASEIAMNATVPSSTTYTFTLSGGTLGTLVQTVFLGAQQYPNIPYLTGTEWSDVQAYAAAAPFTIAWNNPGALTQASGLTVFDISSVYTEAELFFELTSGAALSSLVPANTLAPTQPYEGFLTFTSSSFPGAGGAGSFGVGGAAHHAVSLSFYVQTTATTYCSAGVSTSGCQATLTASGLPSASAGAGFVLSAGGVEGNKDGLFFYGTNGRQASPWGNGTSFQCVVPPVKRGGLLTGSGLPSFCNGFFLQDLNARWVAKPNHNPGAGATMQAQLWYRDPMNTSNQTTSLSDAIEFEVGP